MKRASSSDVPSWHFEQAATVIRFDGRGAGNIAFGGMWSRVLAGAPQYAQVGAGRWRDEATMVP